MIFQVCQKLPLNKFMKLALQKNRAIEYLEFPTIFCPQNHKSVVGEGGHFQSNSIIFLLWSNCDIFFLGEITHVLVLNLRFFHDGGGRGQESKY